MVGEVNWSLLQMPDIGQAFKQGYDGGRQRNALAAYAQNPDNPQALNALAEFNPQFVVQAKKLQADQQQTAAEDARKRQQEQFTRVGRLLDHATDETTYQQARAAAQGLGLDMSKIPPNYNPAWVQQQRLMLSAFEKDGGQQISGLARELQDAGYQPGTPQFQQAMVTALEGKYAPTYTDSQGRVMQGTLPTLPQASPAPQQSAPAQESITFEMFRGATNGLGAQGAAAWLQRNGLPVQVATPQEARQLPRGTKIILPDGSEGVVP